MPSWEIVPFTDRTARNEAVKEAKKLRAQGLSHPAIAKRLKVRRSFVEYHTLSAEGKRRRLDGRLERWKRASEVDRGIRVCPGCGDEREVTGEYLRRIAAGQRSEYCASCARLRASGKPLPQRTFESSRAWQRPEEQESTESWLRRVEASWDERERAEVVGAIASLLESLAGDDWSRPARHAGPARERSEFRPHPYAPIERPFGAHARGEREAA